MYGGGFSGTMACNWHSNDVKITENVTFRNMFLPERVLRGLEHCGFEVPSPIQLNAIPWGRCGLDMIIQAKSGTGKTLVAAALALEHLNENSCAQALFLAPTREVAVQICDVIRSIGSAFPNLQCHSFIGGVPVSKDLAKLSGCQIAVGTPGRIKHLIVENCLDTRAIRLFVLDEADALLEKSFIDDINSIYSSLPSNKQVIALSATYPRSLAEMLKQYMKNPKHLELNSNDTGLLGISQFYKNTQFHPIPDFADASKFLALLNILSTITFSQCMIFCKQPARVEDIVKSLNDRGFSTCGISSSLDQADRLKIIAKLKHFQCRILVSTDLTARSIDAENVNLVVNYDIPNTPETYLHRMGRAGRYGTSGILISLISSDNERNTLKSFQQHYHFTVDELPEPIPDDIWNLIFEKKFMTSPTMENVKASGEKDISTKTVESFDCLDTPAIANSNHSVAENFENDVNSDCVKNNLENSCNIPEADNVSNLNNHCKAEKTSINVLQNYEELLEDHKGSVDSDTTINLWNQNKVVQQSSCIDLGKNADEMSKGTGPTKIPSECHDVISNKNNIVLHNAEKDGNTNSSKSISEWEIVTAANKLGHNTGLKKSDFKTTSKKFSSSNECFEFITYNEYLYAVNGLIPTTIIKNSQNSKQTSKLNSFDRNQHFLQKGYGKHQVDQKIATESENGVQRKVCEEKKKDVKQGNWKKIPKDTLIESECSVFSTRKVAADVLMNKKSEYLRKDMGHEVKEHSKKSESQNMDWFPKHQKQELPSWNFSSSDSFPIDMQLKQSQNGEKTKKYNRFSEGSDSLPLHLKDRGHLCCSERKNEEIRRKVCCCCCFRRRHCANSKGILCCDNPFHVRDKIQGCLNCSMRKWEEAQRKVCCCHNRHHENNITAACSCHLTQCSWENEKNFNAAQIKKFYKMYFEQWYYLRELSSWH